MAMPHIYIGLLGAVSISLVFIGYANPRNTTPKTCKLLSLPLSLLATIGYEPLWSFERIASDLQTLQKHIID